METVAAVVPLVLRLMATATAGRVKLHGLTARSSGLQLAVCEPASEHVMQAAAQDGGACGRGLTVVGALLDVLS